jgi:hypothetical protein
MGLSLIFTNLILAMRWPFVRCSSNCSKLGTGATGIVNDHVIGCFQRDTIHA